MDRQKYINDTSYREGYDDGKKEGSELTFAFTMSCLNTLSNDIEYIKKFVSDAFGDKEEGDK